jgi:hypothetical protein
MYVKRLATRRSDDSPSQTGEKGKRLMPHFTAIKNLSGILLCVMMPAMMSGNVFSQESDAPRARDLGVPFDGTPGPFNAISDVQGVTVAHRTLIKGEGKLVVGEGPVRTGVTAILAFWRVR